MNVHSEKGNVSVVLPTFNERGNICELIQRILAAVACWNGGVEVLVVDDDSPDGTWEAVEGLSREDPRIRLHRRRNERGLTSAIWAGIQGSRGDIVVWMDCDLSMPPEVVANLLEEMQQQRGDIVIGSRYVPGGKDAGHSLVGQLFSRTINLFAGLFLGFAVRDYTSGFVAARREVFDHIRLHGDYGEYCIDLIHRGRRFGFKVVEVPYVLVERTSGESKTATNPWGYIRRGTKYVTTILRLRMMPAQTRKLND